MAPASTRWVKADARNRFAKACQELISFSFPNLRMLKGAYDESTLSQALLVQDDLLTSGTTVPTEAEQEILTYVMRNQNDGTRTSIEEIVRYFGRRPYGWYPMAVLTLVSRLFRMGKVELRTGELLDARSALDHLKNTRQHGSVRVRLKSSSTPRKSKPSRPFTTTFSTAPTMAPRRALWAKPLRKLSPPRARLDHLA